DAVVAERPLDDVVVVGGAEDAPEYELLAAPQPGVVFPGQAAIANLFADLSGGPEDGAAGGGRTIGSAQMHEAEADSVVGDVEIARPPGVVGDEELGEAAVVDQLGPRRGGTGLKPRAGDDQIRTGQHLPAEPPARRGGPGGGERLIDEVR